MSPKTPTPRFVPVVNVETPPLEINLHRKASSLLWNEFRASVFASVPGSETVESNSLKVLFCSCSGFPGNLRSPGIRPPPDGSSFTHGMTSGRFLRQPSCQARVDFGADRIDAVSIISTDGYATNPESAGPGTRRRPAGPMENDCMLSGAFAVNRMRNNRLTQETGGIKSFNKGWGQLPPVAAGARDY